MDSDLSVEFCRFIDTSSRYIRATVSEAVKDLGFRYYHVPFLVSIGGCPGISQKGLCRRIPLDKSRVSIVVRELIDQGLAVNDSAGKVWSLRLTSKGREAQDRAMGIVYSMNEELFESVSDEDKDAFLRVIRTVI